MSDLLEDLELAVREHPLKCFEGAARNGGWALPSAEQKDGPWNPIADRLANNGNHVWRMPDQLPYQFFLKVEALDLAGNIGDAVTLEREHVPGPCDTRLSLVENQQHAPLFALALQRSEPIAASGPVI